MNKSAAPTCVPPEDVTVTSTDALSAKTRSAAAEPISLVVVPRSSSSPTRIVAPVKLATTRSTLGVEAKLNVTGAFDTNGSVTLVSSRPPPSNSCTWTSVTLAFTCGVTTTSSITTEAGSTISRNGRGSGSERLGAQ